MTKRQDLVVIGGGPGGLVVASVAAQAGLKVTLVEKTPLLFLRRTSRLYLVIEPTKSISRYHVALTYFYWQHNI